MLSELTTVGSASLAHCLHHSELGPDGNLHIDSHDCRQHYLLHTPGSAFIKPDQLDPWIKDQIKITLLPTISYLLLPNFVSCGRACPSHMTQNLVTVGAKLWTAERFLVDP